MFDLLIYLLIGIALAVPFSKVVQWFLGSSAATSYSAPITVKSPRIFTVYWLSQLLIIFITYGALLLAYRYFYYNDPIYFIAGATLIICSFLWPVFSSFSQKNSIFSFLIGFYCYFNWLCLPLLLLMYIIYFLISNNRSIIYLLIIATNFLTPFIFEVKEFFLLSNIILFALFFLKSLSHLDNYFSSSPDTIIKEFHSR